MEPQIFSCDAYDDPPNAASEWVLKLMGKNGGELIGDWVGCLLARALGLRTPAVDVAEVDEEALQTAPASVRAWAKPGPAFASAYMSDSQNVPSDKAVLDLCPGDFVGALYAVDTWLEVLDRKKPEGTWNILRRDVAGDSNPYAIDFGKCIAECLFSVPVTKPAIMRPARYPTLVRQAASLEAALAMANSIAALDEQLLADVIASIPFPWLSKIDQRNCILSFLTSRKARVRTICGQLKEGLP